MLQRKDYRMGSNGTSVVDLVFTLLIAVLSIAGYVLTNKRIGQRWYLWIILAVGWFIMAIPYILFLAGLNTSVAAMAAIWLSSYIIIMVSLVLIFLKLLEMMKNKEK